MSEALRAANCQLVRDYLDAVSFWKLDVITALSTEDVVFEVPFCPPGFERVTQGRERYVEVLRQASTVMIEGPENLHDIKVDTLAGDPGELVVEYKSAMVLRSGAAYSNRYLARFTVRDGRVARFTEYCDPISLYTAMGGHVPPLQALADNSMLPPLLSTENA
ncbi:nuclear transport factor 2 family protein [Aquisediminimonas sediminicola]|uniref:nuclear transport factor 2 family protein n=1 Tax=Alteraquisediminimonas sediminicola TaxID=2676787 RepID=UPI001C8E022E|nr:nuclear transport factor 2 family protein [Aquisediminimonas sediminicola]